MTVSNAQLVADRDQQFADWGETVTFREVTQTFDPQTQQVNEAVVDTALTAVVGAGPSKPTRGAAAQHLTGEVTFLIKAEELPTSDPRPTSRVIHDGTAYDVIEFHRSMQGLVFFLECKATV